MKIKGKLYYNGTCIIMCTEDTKEGDRKFAGVVIKNNDKTSDHKRGNYSATWTESVFEPVSEKVSHVYLRNEGWEPQPEMGTSCGS